MKIELDIITKVKEEVKLPIYLRENNDYYVFFDENNLKRNIRLSDYTIGKWIDYNTDFKSLNELLNKNSTTRITAEAFHDKFIEILTIINGVVNEVYKAHEQ